jgi:hypothetical protein
MEQKGVALVRELMDQGFFYDNLEKMAQDCGKEALPDRVLTAHVVRSILSDLARELGDKPVTVSTAKKLEARYRTDINLALEKALSGAPPEDQFKRLTRLVSTHWNIKEQGS